MAIPRIEKLSYAELTELQSRVEALIDQRKAEEQVKVRQKAAELAAKAGFNLEDIVATRGGNGSAKGKGSKVAPKYRNPKDPSQTWTGRGRQPKWLATELKKGRKLESFRIK